MPSKSALLNNSIAFYSTLLKSKFKLSALLTLILLAPILYTTIFLIFNIVTNETARTTFILFYVIGFSILILMWLVFGELRTKIVKITILPDKIISTNFLGFGATKVFFLNELDGLKTAHLPSRGGTYEYLYVILNEKKVVKISEFYHKNYQELKHELLSKTKNLGIERFSYIKELKEIFG